MRVILHEANSFILTLLCSLSIMIQRILFTYKASQAFGTPYVHPASLRLSSSTPVSLHLTLAEQESERKKTHLAFLLAFPSSSHSPPSPSAT